MVNIPTKTWVVGEEVLAADFNLYVQKQVIATFANAVARDAALPTPTEGMACYLLDTHTLQIRRATYWAPPSGNAVYSDYAGIPDLNAVGIGLRDVAGIAQGVTFPYPTRVFAHANVGVGYGADWCAWRTDMVPYAVAGFGPTTGGAANAAMWSHSTMSGYYSVPANTSIGYKARVNVDRTGNNNSSNFHTDGQITITAYAS